MTKSEIVGAWCVGIFLLACAAVMVAGLIVGLVGLFTPDRPAPAPAEPTRSVQAPCDEAACGAGHWSFTAAPETGR